MQNEFLDYFDPIDLTQLKFDFPTQKGQLVQIDKYTKDFCDINLSEYDLAIIGVGEYRNAFCNSSAHQSPNLIRQKFYQLYSHDAKIRIIDLGNLKLGITVNDTYAGLRDIISHLVANKVLPIVIGGSQDLTFPMYLACIKLDNPVNVVSIDSRLDIGDAQQTFDSQSYLSKIVLHNSKKLFNYSNIGYQSYLVAPSDIALMEKLLFDAYRLGLVRSKISDFEPVLRDADIVSFDLGAIKYADSPGQPLPSPNGLWAHDACQLALYAGMSDKVSMFGLFEYNEEKDVHGITASLSAQILWFFIEGYYQRLNELPSMSSNEFTQFVVPLSVADYDIVFYKSNKTDRWWMEVPHPIAEYKRNLILACNYSDYKTAAQDDIPERWMRFFKKLN